MQTARRDEMIDKTAQNILTAMQPSRKLRPMRSKVPQIFFSQKQTQVKEDHLNNLLSTRKAIDAY